MKPNYQDLYEESLEEIEELKRERESMWETIQDMGNGIKKGSKGFDEVLKANKAFVKVNKQFKTQHKKEINEILKEINSLENTYPKDIFKWTNKEKLDFNRGRFYRHCYDIVNNTREEVKKVIKRLL